MFLVRLRLFTTMLISIACVSNTKLIVMMITLKNYIYILLFSTGLKCHAMTKDFITVPAFSFFYVGFF